MPLFGLQRVFNKLQELIKAGSGMPLWCERALWILLNRKYPHCNRFVTATLPIQSRHGLPGRASRKL